MAKKFKSGRDQQLEKMLGCRSKYYVTTPAEDQPYRSDDFVTGASDRSFIQNYATHLLHDMVEREGLNQFVFKIHKSSHLKVRAYAIDQLFQASNDAKMEDKSVVYQAISMMDRFLNKSYY